MELSSGAMTNRLDRLEEAGLVRRRPDPNDRRGVLMEMTEKGRETYERAVGVQAKKEELVTSALDAGEKKQLNDLLRRLMLEFERREQPAWPKLVTAKIRSPRRRRSPLRKPTTRNCARTCTTGSPNRSRSKRTARSFGRPDSAVEDSSSIRDLAGIDGEELDALIARQIQVFARARASRSSGSCTGTIVRPISPDRLLAAGLVPEETETVVIGRVDAVIDEPTLPDGVVIREVHERGDFAGIAQLEESVWNEEHNGSTASPTSVPPTRKACASSSPRAGGLTVEAGWVRFPSETEFVTLWGGATLPAWRGRGIYRALVARRAKTAAERGRRYIEVDASDDSRPILERLGFVPVTTTTPYVWPVAFRLRPEERPRATAAATDPGGEDASAPSETCSPPSACSFSGRRASRTRTGDLLGAIEALSQLSYSPEGGTV